MRTGVIALAVLGLAALIVLSNTVFIVDQTQQAFVTRFGKPIGAPIMEPGLKVKVPFVDRVHRFERRWLAWDGDANQIPTKDKKYIWVDTYARWRVQDPLRFFEKVRDERGAQTRLDDIIDGATRNAIASYHLIEVVRATNRPFAVSDEIKEIIAKTDLPTIEKGRDHIAQEILRKAAAVTPDFGIELVDVRFKRIDYVESVRQKVYERMISERQRIAERYRSQGQGKTAEISGERERELRKIRSEAYRKTEEIRGKADAEATGIYAAAYNKDPELYGFLKTMETWRSTMDKNTSLILTTDSELFRYLKRSGPPLR